MERSCTIVSKELYLISSVLFDMTTDTVVMNLVIIVRGNIRFLSLSFNICVYNLVELLFNQNVSGTYILYAGSW